MLSRPVTGGEVLLAGAVVVGFAMLGGAYLVLNGIALALAK